MVADAGQVDAFVDPRCPFAWITAQWLAEVSARSGLQVRRRLMCLSVVHQGLGLEGWYRAYNDRAWRPARVAAALLASPDAVRGPAFYQTFVHRRHVLGVRDDDANLTATVAELDLPPALLDAADDPGWDGDLRRRTKAAVDPLHADGGRPVLHLNGTAFFGPVQDGIPRGADAVAVWDALRVLAETPSFAELKRGRSKRLTTS